MQGTKWHRGQRQAAVRGFPLQGPHPGRPSDAGSVQRSSWTLVWTRQMTQMSWMYSTNCQQQLQ